MEKLSIVTFISGSERPNTELLEMYHRLRKTCGADELLVFSDRKHGITGENVREIVSPDTTKFKRIMLSFGAALNEKILYVDNDISPCCGNLEEFIRGFREDTDLCFGRIAVKNPDSFTAELIRTDKKISHEFIRPMLWRLNIGISVPGQVFMLRREKFMRDMEDSPDTVFDDLALGICAKQNGYRVQISSLVLGYERPSGNLCGLLRQRIRWAKGYCEQLTVNRKNRQIFPLAVIHGLAYHAMIPVLILVLMICAGWAECITVMLVVCAGVSDFSISRMLYAGAYFMIFPFVHLVWFAALVRNFLKG
ncbi:MAG: glycosyltransferase family 2 protein [Synergistaceae bacterium]|nr:glycosyltransferase family 2 protein [Synergistaceae bacterium]